MEKTINATEKQVKFMNQLGIRYDNPTMQEARELIQNKLAEDEKDNIEREPVKPNEEAEKKAVYDKHKVDTKSNGFKLTEENIRIGALDCALKLGQNDKNHDSKEFWNVVKKFEKYIRFGK